MCFRMDKLFSVKHINIFGYSYFMATCFGPSDHNLAILQKLNLGTCSCIGSYNTYRCVKYF